MTTSANWTPEKYFSTIRDILRMSASDKAVREEALRNPDALLERVGGATIAAEQRGTTKFVETPEEHAFLLPEFGSVSEPDELTDADLETVAGAGSPWCMWTDGCYCFWTK